MKDNKLRLNVKCELCEEYIPFKNTLIISNKINGNELRICKKCAKNFEIKVKK